MKDGSDTQDKLIWRWTKGTATSQTELSDPTMSGSDYSLCIYTGVAESLRVTATVPGGASGWAAIGSSGYQYKDRAGTIQGIQKLLLKGHAGDKAKMFVKGSGADLPDPDLSLATTPVRVQLRKSDAPSLCWETTFVGSDVITNDTAWFTAKQIN
jgi:hypothetical protein